MNRLLMILYIALCCVCRVAAQGRHVFTLQPNTQSELPVKVRQQLDLKIQQALIRQGALASDTSGVLQVRTHLTLNSDVPPGQAPKDITSLRGQLYLTIVNRLDGSKYHQATKDVHATVPGDAEAAHLHIVKRLSITDPLWAKFVSAGRQKIEDYYRHNAQSIIQRAETLYKAQQYRECVAYLGSIPITVDFYSQVKTLHTLCNKALQSQEQEQ